MMLFQGSECSKYQYARSKYQDVNSSNTLGRTAWSTNQGFSSGYPNGIMIMIIIMMIMIMIIKMMMIIDHDDRGAKTWNLLNGSHWCQKSSRQQERNYLLYHHTISKCVKRKHATKQNKAKILLSSGQSWPFLKCLEVFWTVWTYFELPGWTLFKLYSY